jgi:hypothetical protein
MDDSIADFRLTDHAKVEMARRQIDESIVTRVLEFPDQVLPVREGRKVYQGKIEMGESKEVYLLRVFVDTDRTPPEVVTVYRTSKFDKYWRVGS